MTCLVQLPTHVVTFKYFIFRLKMKNINSNGSYTVPTLQIEDIQIFRFLILFTVSTCFVSVIHRSSSKYIYGHAIVIGFDISIQLDRLSIMVHLFVDCRCFSI